MTIEQAEHWMSRCASCLDFEYDDPTLGKCIHFNYCKSQEKEDDNEQ